MESIIAFGRESSVVTGFTRFGSTQRGCRRQIAATPASDADDHLTPANVSEISCLERRRQMRHRRHMFS